MIIFKIRKLLFALNLVLLLVMWFFLFYHGLNMLILIILFVLIAILTVFIYRTYITKAIGYEKIINEISNGKKLEQFLEEEDNQDEFLTVLRLIVSEHFKDVSKKHSAQILDKQVQIGALQSQINPHFLYNTMESIRGQAMVEGAHEIARMAEALSSYFRYNIDQKGNFVTLQEEINNVQNYMLIQEYRFHNKFSSNVIIEDNDDSIYDYLLPKLTIQPIVENAIYHGLEVKGEEGVVNIEIVTTEKRLLIKISDNGIGMSRETLDNVNNKLKDAIIDNDNAKNAKGVGIALINVNKRIELAFGKQYGIQVYSTLNKGTDVEITLPLVKEKTNLFE